MLAVREVPPVSEAMVAMELRWSGSSPDVQRRYLLDAAESVELFTDRHPAADGPDGELAAKALHLVACVAAVDHMCRQGDLPREWRADKGAARGTMP